ncbi:MAG: iron ABC transporter permease, partial [Spirochaetota bacterium]
MFQAMTYTLRKYTRELKQVLREPLFFISVLILFLLLILFIIYPLFEAAKLSLRPEGEFSLGVYKFIFSHSRFKHAILNSILLGAIVATTATIIGFIFAYALTRAKIPGQKLFKNFVLLPIISPPFMFALSVILLFGRNGLITAGLLKLEGFDVYGLKGLVLVQTIAMFPIAYMTLAGILQSLNPDLEDCSMNLGAKHLHTFLTVTLPLALPGLLASWLLVFVGSLTDFGNPIVLGGNFNVLSVQAYLEFTGMSNLPRGSALALLLLVPTIFIFLIQKRVLGKKSYTTITGKSSRRAPKTSTVLNKILFIACLLIILFVFMFYITIIAGSFVKLWGINWKFTLDHFTYSIDVGLTTIKNTLILAIIATPITALLGIIIAFLVERKSFPGKRLLEFLSMMSYAIPGTAVGIGYILAFNKPPFLLSGTALILIICYVFRDMPVGVEAGIASLKQISKEIEESSMNLGANISYTFRHI